MGASCDVEASLRGNLFGRRADVCHLPTPKDRTRNLALTQNDRRFVSQVLQYFDHRLLHLGSVSHKNLQKKCH